LNILWLTTGSKLAMISESLTPDIILIESNNSG
jgi:hypothetical protein